jgi:lysine-N-methylase
MKLGPDKSCPFLNEAGLCNIMIHNGEADLPKTCRSFPRLENSIGKLKEYSLSCACPTVVDIIHDLNGNISFLNEGEKCQDILPTGYRIRETMLSILQNPGFSLKDRLLLSFHMLLSLLRETDEADEIITGYQDDQKLEAVAYLWRGVRPDAKDVLLETNELFLDMTQNYKEEINYREYLQDITELAETLVPKNYLSQWKEFQSVFGHFEKLIENCLVSKVFAYCISNDMDELMMSYQLIITEYVMIRYSAFLQWTAEKELDYKKLRDDIVMFSRIIGYNTEGIREFWEYSFDEAVWELGYMLLLVD